MTTKEKLSITLDKDLVDKIKKLAEEDNRNVSNIIETILYEKLGK